MANYRLHPITWKNVIDYNWLRLQITITPCLDLNETWYTHARWWEEEAYWYWGS
jgi:hypothetical protein